MAEIDPLPVGALVTGPRPLPVGPLVTIDFAFRHDGGATAIEVRYWYHVPRIGDSVRLTAMGLRRNPDDVAPEVQGDVVGVRWRDDGTVLVALKERL